MTNKILKVLTLLCTILLHNLSYAQSNFYSLLANKSYAERSQLFDTVVLKYYKSLPENKFATQIESLRQEAKEHNDYPVSLEVLMGNYEYYDFNGIYHTADKIKVYKEELKKINKTKYKEYVTVLMFHLGNNYFGKKHDYTKAFEYYIKVEDALNNFTYNEFPDKKSILVSIANRYYNIGDYVKAKQLLFAADTLPKSWITLTNYDNKNTLGLIYRHYQQYDSAIYYFQETKKEAVANDSKIWEAIAHGNIGISYYNQGKLSKAIPYLQKDVKECFAYNNSAYDNGMTSLLILANIYLDLDSLAKVQECIAKAVQKIDSTKDPLKHYASYYPVLAKYNFKKSNYKAAYSFSDSATKYNDSLIKRDDIYKLAQVAHKLEVDKHISQLHQLGSEKALIKRTRNGTIAGIALIFIITILIINRKRLKHRLKSKNLELQNELAESELQQAHNQLEAITESISKKNNLLDRSRIEIEKLREQLSEVEQNEANEDMMQQLYTATILTDEEWEEYKQVFEQVHKGFLIRLKEKLPELSPADVRYIVLSKLKMSNKEMAAILGVRPDTIRTYKHRLRKKINLPEGASITDFADSI